MKRYLLITLTFIMLTGCASSKEPEETKDPMDMFVEQLDSYSGFEQGLDQGLEDPDYNEIYASGQSKEQSIEELGYTQENQRIVLKYRYDNYDQYNVYIFEDDGYSLSIYCYYDTEEDFHKVYKNYYYYGAMSANNVLFDRSLNLYKYDERYNEIKRENGYSAIMYSYQIQLKSCSEGFISLIE